MRNVIRPKIMRKRELTSQETIQVWDIPTRTFKWLLVAAIVAAWATNKYAVPHPGWHKWTGYAVLVLLIFRLLWGFFGSSTSRFSGFVASPRSVARYARNGLIGWTRPFKGHNPLGGWMIILLLCVVGMQAILGLFSAGEDYLSLQGPLTRTVGNDKVDMATRLHRWGFNVILCLVAVHVTANVLSDVFKRTGLIQGMITGRKPQAQYVDDVEFAPGSPWAAAICVIAAIFILVAVLALL